MEKGLIVTNRRAARISPSLVKIQFFDGTIKNGRVIYTDAIVPFGIVEIKGSLWNKDSSKYSELKLGSAENTESGAKVSLIGTTPEGTYISKSGKVINSNRNFSTRYGALFQTSFDRVTNLAGSPVFNEQNLVVGIHVIASETTSYELKINYVTNILSQIKKQKKQIERGDIGISIDLIILGIAKINYKLSNDIADIISKNLIKTGGPPELMVISSILPNSPSSNVLKTGDIIYKVNDKVIANDFLLFDNILNQNVGKKIAISVSRNGEIKNLDIEKVDNTENNKITKYVSFAGAYFHDISNMVKYFLYSNIDGVYLTYTNIGSPFSKVASPGQVK